MRRTALVALTLALTACSKAADEAPAVTEIQMAPEVTQALGVAGALQANPAMADSILSANGLTRAGFDSLLYRIATDSVLSAQYAKGN